MQKVCRNICFSSKKVKLFHKNLNLFLYENQTSFVTCFPNQRQRNSKLLKIPSDQLASVTIDEQFAKKIIKKLTQCERDILTTELQKYEKNSCEDDSVLPLTKDQIKTLFAFNCAPFIGFGFFDNFIMIVAGEYIDFTLGVLLGFSTMAAAAIGNLISDLAGVRLSLYIEAASLKMGLLPPDLSSEQMELPKTLQIIAFAKLFGITIGCIIGMFPLLFLKNKKEEDTNTDDPKP